MRHQFLMTIATASALCVPAYVGAQRMHDRPPVSQGAGNQPATSESLRTRTVPTLPNRKVPGLAPPQAEDVHPVAPDEAWPKRPSSNTPVRPSVSPDTENNMNDNTLIGDDGPDLNEPLQRINGVEELGEQ